MPRPALPPEQRRVSRSVRLRPDEWAAVDREARERHCSAADVLRAALEAEGVLSAGTLPL